MMPEELTQYAQWVVWRLVEREDGKPTKVPFNPNSPSRMASVNEPQSWGTYEQAVSTLNSGAGFAGVGFVLTEADPFAFVDLDETVQPDQLALQSDVYDRIVSYAETSPSGKGLHIIARGKLPDGKKRYSVEVYTSRRFMTMTGNVYRDMPILDCQVQLESLHAHLTGDVNPVSATIDFDERYTDQEVGDMAYRNVKNGALFDDLWAGRWVERGYASQSEADFALVDIIAFYSRNRAQVRRMFLASALGQRDKPRTHPTYLEHPQGKGIIDRAFDNMMPEQDLNALRAQIDALFTNQQAQGHTSLEQVPQPDPTPLTKWQIPPGLLGEIAEFIYGAAKRPLREVALVGAMGFMSGLTGRAYNVSGTGLNQYYFLVGGTGIGKSAIRIGFDLLGRELLDVLPQAKTFFGPSEIASAQGLQNWMADGNPSLVVYSGEIGHILKQFKNPFAPEKVEFFKRLLLNIYEQSGEGHTWNGSAYADKLKNAAKLISPSFTWIGETTPARFDESMSEDMIRDGVIPRFLTITSESVRPDARETVNRTPSRQLVNRIAALALECLKMNGQNKAHDVKLDKQANELLGSRGEFDRFCDEKIRGNAEEFKHELWNRAHLKAMKLAAVVAVGESVGSNIQQPIITRPCAEWAIGIVSQDTERMLQRFESGQVLSGDLESQQLHRVVAAVRDWYKRPWHELMGSAEGYERFHTARLIPYAFIQRRCVGIACFRNDKLGPTKAVKRCLETLVERGDLAFIPKHTIMRDYGIEQLVYAAVNFKTFGM